MATGNLHLETTLEICIDDTPQEVFVSIIPRTTSSNTILWAVKGAMSIVPLHERYVILLTCMRERNLLCVAAPMFNIPPVPFSRLVSSDGKFTGEIVYAADIEYTPFNTLKGLLNRFFDTSVVRENVLGCIFQFICSLREHMKMLIGTWGIYKFMLYKCDLCDRVEFMFPQIVSLRKTASGVLCSACVRKMVNA